jgi:hypothetical protein
MTGETVTSMSSCTSRLIRPSSMTLRRRPAEQQTADQATQELRNILGAIAVLIDTEIRKARHRLIGEARR